MIHQYFTGERLKVSTLITEIMPPRDWNYRCIIVFRDGSEAQSDGGTCWNQVIWNLPSYLGWKIILKN